MRDLVLASSRWQCSSLCRRLRAAHAPRGIWTFICRKSTGAAHSTIACTASSGGIAWPPAGTSEPGKGTRERSRSRPPVSPAMSAFHPPEELPPTAIRPGSSPNSAAWARTQRTAAVASRTWAGKVPCEELRTEKAATA